MQFGRRRRAELLWRWEITRDARLMTLVAPVEDAFSIFEEFDAHYCVTAEIDVTSRRHTVRNIQKECKCRIMNCNDIRQPPVAAPRTLRTCGRLPKPQFHWIISTPKNLFTRRLVAKLRELARQTITKRFDTFIDAFGGGWHRVVVISPLSS